MNGKDITNPVPIKPAHPAYQEEYKSPSPFLDFVPQSMSPLIGFSQDPFQPNYMNMGNQYGIYYPPYQAQYQNHSYGYQTSPYKNNNYSERKNNHGYRKSYSPGATQQQVFYTKKPQAPLNGESDTLAEDFKKLVVSDTTTVDANGTLEKVSSNLEKAKFFVIKSYSEEDVHKAVKYNVWCSTRYGNAKLHDAFVTANGQYPVFLLFSVNSSGHFVGVAQMKSAVDFEKDFPGWNQSHKWKGVFKISWLYIKDLPNRELRHLKNELNEGKPVPNSRDCQEVPLDVGRQVLTTFESYKHQTSILDDFDFYEVRETSKCCEVKGYYLLLTGEMQGIGVGYLCYRHGYE